MEAQHHTGLDDWLRSAGLACMTEATGEGGATTDESKTGTVVRVRPNLKSRRYDFLHLLFFSFFFRFTLLSTS